MTSAQMKPLSKSVCIAPAACKVTNFYCTCGADKWSMATMSGNVGPAHMQCKQAAAQSSTDWQSLPSVMHMRWRCKQSQRNKARQKRGLMHVQFAVHAKHMLEHLWGMGDLRRLGLFAYLPALDLVCTCCEEVDQLNRFEACGHNLVYCTCGANLQGKFSFKHNRQGPDAQPDCLGNRSLSAKHANAARHDLPWSATLTDFT